MPSYIKQIWAALGPGLAFGIGAFIAASATVWLAVLLSSARKVR